METVEWRNMSDLALDAPGTFDLFTYSDNVCLFLHSIFIKLRYSLYLYYFNQLILINLQLLLLRLNKEYILKD